MFISHLLGRQSLMSVSQVSPVYPALQEHTKSPSVLMQVPRFLQGLAIHSFTSILHNWPEDSKKWEEWGFICKLQSRLPHNTWEQSFLTLPSWLAVTLIAQVVWCVGADSMIGTGVRGARGEDLSTSGSTVRKFTQTSETCHTVHTGALVQTGAGCTFIDVHLAKVTCQKYKWNCNT